jgi:hypothetical protein
MMKFKLRPIAILGALALIIVLTIYNFGIWAGLCAIGAAATVLCASALAFKDFYDGDFRTSLHYHWSILIGTKRGFHKIEDGTTSLPQNAKGPVLGPRLVIVAPYNAVVMERGSKQTSIRGPETFETGAFEFAKRIYDLRQRQEALTFHDVLTSDTLLTTITLSVTYNMGISSSTKIGQRKLTVAERGILQKIDLSMPDWERGTRSAIERSVREAVRERELASLLELRDLDDLGERICELSRHRIQAWGIHLDQMRVESVQPKSEVTTATTEFWVAGKDKETQFIRAKALSDWLKLLAEGFKQAEGTGFTEQAVYKEAWCRGIERISKTMPEGIVLAPEVDQALITLRRSAGLDL